MKNTSKFQNVVIATIVGWLVLFVFLPNLMIIATSFLTRDDARFVRWSLRWNYSPPARSALF
jgi:spermidine/putrescine transport system permease protein